MTITRGMKRNFFLTLFLSACVLTVGGFLFHDTAVGDYVVPGVAFFGGLILFDVLNDRERRRLSERGASPPSY